MTQGQKAFAAIVFGYLVFTTIKGNLITWLQILGLRESTEN